MKPPVQFLNRLSETAIPAAACGLLLAGCSFTPNYTKPPVATPAAYKELTPTQFDVTDGWKSAEPKDDRIRSQWWLMFREPQLTSFENRVSTSNQSVAVAFANFLAARAVVKQTRSQFFPTLSANPSVTRARDPVVAGKSGSSPAAPTATTYSLPFDASWELDFWGRIRNSVKASALEARATLADLESVRLTVQAELAVDYFQVRVLDEQKRLLEAEALAYQESLELTRVQQHAGIASGQDIAQAQTQLTLTRAQTIDLGIQRAQLEHAIATLLGEPASSFSIPAASLAAQPIPIAFGVPSQLLERRPDVSAAERRVAEANARIGVARAAYYPTITLSGSAGFQSTSLENLLSASGLAWSVGSTLAQTLFDGGNRRAITEQSRALYQEAVANYRQTVLTAFQEVEDNLSDLRLLSQELHLQEAAVDSSQDYLSLATARYKSGLDNFLTVLLAQVNLVANQRVALSLRMQQLTASVQLIKAVGGGWADIHESSTALP